MKTLKITSALCLFLILAGITSGFSAPAGIVTKAHPVNSIRYIVNVKFEHDIDLCNLYVILITDESGKQVSPLQNFIPGTSAYSFTERGPVSGTRVASMIINPYILHFICPNELQTTPDPKTGEFLPGSTYLFNLTPRLHGDPEAKIKETPKE